MAGVRKKQLNFIRAAKRKEGRKTEDKLKLAGMILLPIILVAIFGFYLLSSISTINSNHMQTKAINDYINSPDVVAKQAELDKKQAKVEELDAYMNNRIEAEEEAKVIEAQSKQLNTLLDTSTDSVIVNNITFATGVVDADGYGLTYKDCEAYITKIKASDLYTDVTYTGFEEQTYFDGSVRYYFHITCTVKGGI